MYLNILFVIVGPSVTLHQAIQYQPLPDAIGPHRAVSLPHEQKLYRKDAFGSDFDPASSWSLFYTLEPPTSTFTDRGVRVSVYSCSRNLSIIEDLSIPDDPPLKYSLSAACMGVMPSSCLDVSMMDVVNALTSARLDGMLSRMDTRTSMLELVICLPPSDPDSPLRYHSSYEL